MKSKNGPGHVCSITAVSVPVPLWLFTLMKQRLAVQENRCGAVKLRP